MLYTQYLYDNKLWTKWANQHIDWLKQQSPILNKYTIKLAGSRWFRLAHPDSDVEFVIITHENDTNPLTEIAKIYSHVQLGNKMSITKTKRGFWSLQMSDINQDIESQDNFPVVNRKTMGKINKRLPHKIEFVIMDNIHWDCTVKGVEKFLDSKNEIEKYMYILEMIIAFKDDDTQRMNNIKQWKKEIKME
jgi:hypothetical protein